MLDPFRTYPCVTKAVVETQRFDPFVPAKHLEKMTWESSMETLSFGGTKILGFKRRMIWPMTLYHVESGRPIYKGTPLFHPEFLTEGGEEIRGRISE